MADQASQVQLENTTEHVLHITLEGGAIISVPPKEQGSQTVTFNDGEERAKFERALATETVKGWLDRQELVIHGIGAVATPQQPQNPQGAQNAPSSAEPQSTGAASRRPRGDKE